MAGRAVANRVLAVGWWVGLVVVATQCGGPATVPGASPSAALAKLSMPSFRPVAETLDRVESDYAGLVPLRADVVWSDALDRIQRSSPGQIEVSVSKGETHVTSTKSGATLALQSPTNIRELRLRLFGLVAFCRDSLGDPRFTEQPLAERLAIAAVMCNLDLGSTILPPRQWYETIPEGSPGRESYREAALQEPEPPAGTVCRSRGGADYKPPPITPDGFIDGVFYTRAISLTTGYARDLGERLARATRANGGFLKGIVLDLRSSPGGVLTEAQSVADLFLPAGPAFEMVAPRSAEKPFQTSTDGAELSAPLIILVDEGCASGCELLAGVLRQRERTILIGTPTRGHGSVQMLFNLPSGMGGLKLTTSHLRIAAGKPVEGVGIVPDVLMVKSSAAAGAPPARPPPSLAIQASSDPLAMLRFAALVLKRTRGPKPAQLIDAARDAAVNPEGKLAAAGGAAAAYFATVSRIKTRASGLRSGGLSTITRSPTSRP